jgi:phage terminase small subunit
MSNGFNQTQAAITAGYSPRSASAMASGLLANNRIHAEVERRKKELFDRYDVTADHVIKEMARLGFSNMKDYIRIVDGDAVVDLTNLTEDQAAAISEVTSETYVDGYVSDEDGDREPVRVKRTKLKLVDKKGPLELLGRYVGVFNNDDAAVRDIQITIRYDGATRKELQPLLEGETTQQLEEKAS